MKSTKSFSEINEVHIFYIKTRNRGFLKGLPYNAVFSKHIILTGSRFSGNSYVIKEVSMRPEVRGASETLVSTYTTTRFLELRIPEHKYFEKVTKIWVS